MRQLSTEAAIEKYLKKSIVLYDNVEYMELFQQVFNSYILSNRYWNHDDIKLNLSAGFQSMKDLLSKDTALAADDRLLELVLLANLNEIYFNRSFNQEHIRQVLNKASMESDYSEHQLIASGVLKVNGHLSFGSEAPEFELADANGRIYLSKNVSDTDNITILNFVRKDCQPCRAAFDDLQELSTQFGSKIQIITISTGSGFHETRKYFEENRVS